MRIYKFQARKKTPICTALLALYLGVTAGSLLASSYNLSSELDDYKFVNIGEPKSRCFYNIAKITEELELLSPSEKVPPVLLSVIQEMKDSLLDVESPEIQGKIYSIMESTEAFERGKLPKLSLARRLVKNAKERMDKFVKRFI